LPPSEEINTWVSQTPRNPTDALSQTTLVKDRIARDQGSSPISLFAIIKSVLKGVEILAHQHTLVLAENRILRKANDALNKRRRAKKTRLRQGGALMIEDAHDIIAQEEVDEQIRRDKRSGETFSKEGNLSVRHCGICGKTGHNARTCQEIEDVSSSSGFEELELI
jgi:hypothetical protein